ncbi:MAG: SIMPL domain-containing protein [Verrucomicrobiota bacterium]
MNPKPHLLGVLAGLFLSVGLVWSASLVSGAWVRIAEAQVINVTGSARKNVQADLIVWRGQFATEASDLLAAQRQLKADLGRVEAYLKANGITNYLVSSISIQELKATETLPNQIVQQKTTGYRLIQGVEVRSADVQRVAQLERDSTVLVEQGVLFTPMPAEYIYTKAGETKVEMLAEATKDARARAEQIAQQGGRKIGQLKAARMGVFQITPLYSVETRWEGINDTTALDKTVTAVVAATFSMN